MCERSDRRARGTSGSATNMSGVTYVIAVVLLWALLGFGLRRYAVPRWAATALGLTGAIVLAAAFALIRV